eukprot:CAMPEP_0170584190 /NCGR_PEP_ID=MMETSP0224-20130122/8556_1 /TAXON_ID=285029 /ORGANISM="Togula jolla, Strain CCCM 725" /LENGTH=49 /DNA_ID= /DNA_START= /DNA_END= /DNA_ORIENTATION=
MAMFSTSRNLGQSAPRAVEQRANSEHSAGTAEAQARGAVNTNGQRPRRL